MTLFDLMLQPKVVADAKRYFTGVQPKTVEYHPLMTPGDPPAIWLNEEKMARYRDQMRRFYNDRPSTTRTCSSWRSRTQRSGRCRELVRRPTPTEESRASQRA